MNEIEVGRQIDQMVKFIKQEAEEKAKEIQVSSDEEFNREKLQLLEKEKGKIRKDYERREAQVEVKKKIDYSKNLNDMRLKVLAAREAAIQEIVHEARNKLKEVSKNPGSYKKLLTDLLVQGMHKLGEKAAIVRCRQVDLMAVKEVAETARKNYTAMFGEEAPSLTVDTSDFLAPPPSEGHDSELESCCGGVVLTSTDRRISCSNTLDDRIKIAYQANLPDVRTVLFGAFVAAR